jgi:hypothetical protein
MFLLSDELVLSMKNHAALQGPAQAATSRLPHAAAGSSLMKILKQMMKWRLFYEISATGGHVNVGVK